MKLLTLEERIELLESGYAQVIKDNKLLRDEIRGLRDIAIGAGKLSEIVAKSHITRLNDIYPKTTKKAS